MYISIYLFIYLYIYVCVFVCVCVCACVCVYVCICTCICICIYIIYLCNTTPFPSEPCANKQGAVQQSGGAPHKGKKERKKALSSCSLGALAVPEARRKRTREFPPHT
jgi:hypothetical protein